MTTSFPGGLDSFTNPTSGDTLASPDHAAQHADVNDAVEAIELALLDGAPLFIDDTNERVGIGTVTPTQALDVVGSVNTSGVVSAGGGFSGNGGGVYNLNASQLATGTVPSARVSGIYSGITAVGTLTGLTVGSSSFFAVDGSDATYIKAGNISSSNDILELVSFGSIHFTTDVNNNSTGKTFTWSTNGSGASKTELMLLDEAGRLGIGTTSPSERLQVQGNILLNGDLSIEGYTNASQPAGNIQSYASSTVAAWSSGATSDTSTRYHMRFASPSYPTCGWIYTRYGNLYFVNNSDYRLKENIVPLVGASERVMRLKPCQFNRINSPESIDEGFIAHEVQEVVPTSICGDKDEVDEEGNPVYQGIDQSKMVPLLTAALQETIARVEALEGAAS